MERKIKNILRYRFLGKEFIFQTNSFFEEAVSFISDDLPVHSDPVFFTETEPEEFYGRFLAYSGLSIWEGDDQNYFRLKKAPDIDERIVFFNWIRYNIAKVLKEEYLCFHGALVRKSGLLTAFLGKSGSGKTTLCETLGRKGYEILTDEMILVGEEGSSFIPRDLYIQSQNGFQSEVFGCKIAILNNARRIEELPPLDNIYILSKGQAGFSKILETVHPFDFYMPKDNKRFFNECLKIQGNCVFLELKGYDEIREYAENFK